MPSGQGRSMSHHAGPQGAGVRGQSSEDGAMWCPGQPRSDRPGREGGGGTTKESFRRVIGHFATGVTVITTRDGAEDRGATASAVSSLSLEPPMLLVCLNMRSGTQEVIRRSRVFGVNVLDEDQSALAERFALPGGGKFARCRSCAASSACLSWPTPSPIASTGSSRTSRRGLIGCSRLR